VGDILLAAAAAQFIFQASAKKQPQIRGSNSVQ
jgi:hypothetical protein